MGPIVIDLKATLDVTEDMRRRLELGNREAFTELEAMLKHRLGAAAVDVEEVSDPPEPEPESPDADEQAQQLDAEISALEAEIDAELRKR